MRRSTLEIPIDPKVFSHFCMTFGVDQISAIKQQHQINDFNNFSQVQRKSTVGLYRFNLTT